MRELLLEHLDDHYRFYGEHTGVRTARKHIGWYLEGSPDADSFRDRMNSSTTLRDQWRRCRNGSSHYRTTATAIRRRPFKPCWRHDRLNTNIKISVLR